MRLEATRYPQHSNPLWCGHVGVGGTAQRLPIPHAWRRRPSNGPHMSGVGAPAIRPRTVARARRGVRNRTAALYALRLEATTSPTHMSGVGAPAIRPRTCSAGA
eukprot:gene21762-biopygen16201